MKNSPINIEKDINTRAIGSMLSHELTTPLVAIETGANTTGYYIKKLIETYNIAKAEKLIIPQISSEELKMISSFLEHIETESSASNFIVYLVSSILKTNINRLKKESINIKEIVDSALLKINNKIKHKLENCSLDIKTSSILVSADKDALIAVICILLYNIIKYSPLEHNFEISITSSIEDDYICLEMRYNFLINKEMQGAFTENENYTLSFCSAVMYAVGGSFEQHALDKNSIYKLIFPRNPKE